MSWTDWINPVAGIAGAIGNAVTQSKINEENIKMQREFAQNSIQWRVEDAKRAGVHPLAALGASGYSASPSSVASDTGIVGVGQAISGALDKNAKKLSDLQVRDAELEVMKKEKELANMGQALNTANLFGGGVNGGSVVKSVDGSAPSSGVSAGHLFTLDKETLEARANKVFEVGRGLQLAELPPDKRGKRRFLLTPSENSNLAELVANGGLFMGGGAQITQAMRMRDSLDFIEKWMKEKGFLSKDAKINRSIFNHTMDGFVLEEDEPLQIEEWLPYLSPDLFKKGKK